MIKNIKTLLASFLIVLPILIPVSVYADTFNPVEDACSQGSASNSEICTDATNAQTESPVTGTKGVILAGVNILTIASGVIAVTIIVISGITMITSNGDPGKVKKSRDTIIYTVVGVFVVLLSQAIVKFIISSVS